MMRPLSPPSHGGSRPAVLRQAAHRARGGFSMVELLIVITIIAILVSLLLVGVQGAMRSARIASVVSEITNLEKAIKDFEAEFGMQPPSFIKLHEFATGTVGTGTGWNAGDADTRTSRSIIRQLWKDYNFAAAVDINGDGLTNGTFVLTGAECLVFFLGGVPALQDTMADPTDAAPISLKGFSKIPSAPFASRTGARSGPFYEFKTTQLRKASEVFGSSNNRFYVYFDSIPGQTNPIQYFSSYGGGGYRPAGRDGDISTTADNEVIPGTLGWVYTKTPGTAATMSTPAVPAEPFNPNSFQLISPGPDGQYCETNAGGGFIDGDNGVKVGTAAVVTSTYALPAKTTAGKQLEADNITNFSQGEIH